MTVYDEFIRVISEQSFDILTLTMIKLVCRQHVTRSLQVSSLFIAIYIYALVHKNTSNLFL